MWCLLLGYSFEPKLYSRALCTVWPSVYQSETYARTWIPVWREKTILTSSEVRGSLTSKAWRQFSSALKMTNEAVPSIAFVINSVNGGRFLEFTERKWKVFCTIFSLYEIISLREKHKDCSFVIFPCKFISAQSRRCDWNDKNRLKCKMTYYGKRKVAIKLITFLALVTRTSG